MATAQTHASYVVEQLPAVATYTQAASSYHALQQLSAQQICGIAAHICAAIYIRTRTLYHCTSERTRGQNQRSGKELRGFKLNH